ncbi:MAG: NAD(+)/NADH kinase [Chloroflexi bacterium]|nr:NAD(+)/NADH kinase [Chloroflexota bacterium]
MHAVGILHHPSIAASRPLAQEVYDWLAEKDVAVWLGSTRDVFHLQTRIEESTLLVVLGGDGSLLRVARVSTPGGVPLFGINLGKVGFLTEAQPEEWQQKLARVLKGDYWTEERLMLTADLQRDGRTIQTFSALNELVVGRGEQARVVHFHLRVDGDQVATYTADALIVATPTGSTAYAMAAGGPLLPPQLQNFVVLPVAAHLSLNRTLILHETAEISIHVTMDHEAYITPDGQDGISLQNGDNVIIKKNEQLCTFVRVESPGYFYRRLMARLGYMRQD